MHPLRNLGLRCVKLLLIKEDTKIGGNDLKDLRVEGHKARLGLWCIETICLWCSEDERVSAVRAFSVE